MRDSSVLSCVKSLEKRFCRSLRRGRQRRLEGGVESKSFDGLAVGLRCAAAATADLQASERNSASLCMGGEGCVEPVKGGRGGPAVVHGRFLFSPGVCVPNGPDSALVPAVGY